MMPRTVADPLHHGRQPERFVERLPVPVVDLSAGLPAIRNSCTRSKADMSARIFVAASSGSIAMARSVSPSAVVFGHVLVDTLELERDPR